MKRILHGLIAFFVLLPTLAFSKEISPIVLILNEGDQRAEYLFDQRALASARKQAGDQVVAVISAKDPQGIDKAVAAAKSTAVPNVVYLSTLNDPAKNSRELREPLKAMDEKLAVGTDPKGWQLQLDLPMCRLYGRAPKEGEFMSVGFLVAMDDAPARLTCYLMAMSYYASGYTDDGEKIIPYYVDSVAITMQAMLPDIGIQTAYLAHKDKRDDRGQYLKRESNVYAPGEEIFLRAYLENIGRENAGTVDGKYQIDLALELREPDGNVIQGVDLHSYKAASTLLYPMSPRYFRNDITAGISLPDPGDYIIAFIFKDASRPGTKPAEAVFPVVIK